MDAELPQGTEATEDAGAAHVVIERRKRFGDLFRAYEIYVDEEWVGEIRHGETISFDIVPGSYLIHTQIDWCRSERVGIEVADGETVRLQTRARSPLLFVGIAPPEERKLPGT